MGKEREEEGKGLLGRSLQLIMDKYARALLFSNQLHEPVLLIPPGGSDSKESACNTEDLGSNPSVRKRRSPGEGWQPTPVFLPGESHGQRRLAGHSPWGHKKSGMTERLTLSLSCY